MRRTQRSSPEAASTAATAPRREAAYTVPSLSMTMQGVCSYPNVRSVTHLRVYLSAAASTAISSPSMVRAYTVVLSAETPRLSRTVRSLTRHRVFPVARSMAVM